MGRSRMLPRRWRSHHTAPQYTPGSSPAVHCTGTRYNRPIGPIPLLQRQPAHIKQDDWLTSHNTTGSHHTRRPAHSIQDDSLTSHTTTRSHHTYDIVTSHKTTGSHRTRHRPACSTSYHGMLVYWYKLHWTFCLDKHSVYVTHSKTSINIAIE